MAKVKSKKITIEDALVPVEEQPYEVPGNWCWVYLNNLCSDFIVPQRDKPKKFDGDIPWCRIEDIEGDYLNDTLCNQYVSEKTIKEMNLRVCPKGTVICSCSASLGIQAILTRPCCTNQTFIGLVCNKGLYNKYLFWYLREIGDYFEKIGTGTTIKYISKEKFKKLNIPLPPLAEQYRIVEQIDSLFSKLDEAKERVSDALASYEYRKMMIIHKAFTGDFTAHWREIKGLSKERDWKQLTLNDVAEYKKGPFGSSITKAMFVPKADNTYKVYEQGNAIRKTLDYGHYYINESKYNELKSFSVQPGDIIISCAGTIGEVFKLSENCEKGVINQALMRVRIFENINEDYFIYYFGEVLKGDVNEQANGTAIKNIPPFKIMKAMGINLPPKEEQKEIVKIIDSVLSNEDKVKETVSSVIDKIDMLKKSILAKAFRGELGTNDPSEESSIELLKQIIES